MSTEVATQYERSSLAERVSYAKSMALARDLIPRGLWDGAQPSFGKILLVMETGAMLGMHPMAALQSIDVIEGKATVSPQSMSGLVRAKGFELTHVKSGTVAEGDFKIVTTLKRPDDLDIPDKWFVSEWDIPRALQAGLLDSYKQDPTTKRWEVRARSKAGNPLIWEKMPDVMCKWRSIGEVCREGADDVLKGLSYTPEELGADIDDQGQIVEPDPENEDAIIERIKACDDKEDIRQVWRDYHDEQKQPLREWTERVDAEMAAHLSTVTKDSKPRDGAPGHTGEPVVDDVIDGEIVEDDPRPDDALFDPSVLDEADPRYVAPETDR